MEGCCDAPLALLEDDSLSEFDPLEVDDRREPSNLTRTVSDPLDVGTCSNFDGSLANLVTTFDNKIFCCFQDFLTKPEDLEPNKAFTNLASLNHVKNWWRLTAGPDVLAEPYPFDNPPKRLTIHDEDQFELADIDGCTEDGLDEQIFKQTTDGLEHLTVNGANEDAETVTTDPGHSSTVSSLVSSRSVSPDETEFGPKSRLSPTDWSAIPVSTDSHLDESEDDVEQDQQLDVSLHNARLQASLEAFKARHPNLPLHQTTAWFKELELLPLDVLRHYRRELTDEVRRLSDRLVESLASRDLLSQVREASDDFIVLLNLVHNRRRRAARAALLATAAKTAHHRARIKTSPARLTLPWLASRTCVPATSMLTLYDDEDATDEVGEFANATGPTDLNGNLPNSNGVSTDHSVTAPTSDPHNLVSKQRRPKPQPIVLRSASRTSLVTSLRKHLTWMSPMMMLGARRNGPNGIRPKMQFWTPINGVDHQSNGFIEMTRLKPNSTTKTEVGLSQFNGRKHVEGGGDEDKSETDELSQDHQLVAQAEARYQLLLHQTATPEWPNGQPACSRSLSLQLPLTRASFERLRLLNQILHGTLQESPKTDALLSTYTKLHESGRLDEMEDKFSVLDRIRPGRIVTFGHSEEDTQLIAY